jgi:hypothetical protein
LPLTRSAAITSALDAFYVGWYLASAGFVSWILWTQHHNLRARAILAWVLAWLSIGTVAAHLFASGGPFAYGRLVGGEDPFQGLLANLWSIDQSHPLIALDLQARVWENVAAGGGDRWYGMSAMPSLHVGGAVIVALALRTISPLVAALGWASVVLILVGSVALGWHYAIDGYAGATIALAVWWLTGKVTAPRTVS